MVLVVLDEARQHVIRRELAEMFEQHRICNRICEKVRRNVIDRESAKSEGSYQ